MHRSLFLGFLAYRRNVEGQLGHGRPSQDPVATPAAVEALANFKVCAFDKCRTLQPHLYCCFPFATVRRLSREQSTLFLRPFPDCSHIQFLFASRSCKKAAEASAGFADAGEEHGSFRCSFLCGANRRHSLGMGQFQARAARNGPWLCAGSATTESGRTRRHYLCLCWLGPCLCPSRCYLAPCSIIPKADSQVPYEPAALIIFQLVFGPKPSLGA